MKEPLTLLIDGDMLVFEICAALEHEINWEGDLWTLHVNDSEAKTRLDERVSFLIDKVLDKTKHIGAYELLMCFSDKDNFRKKILPTYKANRAGKRRPMCFGTLKEWAMEKYTAYQRPSLEADDCIGILATLKKNTVIVSGDKDMKCIPGRFYDYRRNEFLSISESEADYWHMYQTLIGDATDGYSGCPGVGAKTAEKILANGHTWDIVAAEYIRKGLTEEDALIQAQTARILRKSDYNIKRKEVVLWTPSAKK